MSEPVRVAGLSRFSGSDWPDRMVATVFLQGCPWACAYCHNPDLIDPTAPGALAWADVLRFLRSRRTLLDGVVFSGGEPTMQASLEDAIAGAQETGLRIGLHSGGAVTRRLAATIDDVDWIGFDVKASLIDYPAVTGRRGSGTHAWRSLEVLLESAATRAGTGRPLEYEVRTTVHPALTDEHRLRRLARELAEVGVRFWTLQRARTTGMRPDALLRAASAHPDPIGAVVADVSGDFERLITR